MQGVLSLIFTHNTIAESKSPSTYIHKTRMFLRMKTITHCFLLTCIKYSLLNKIFFSKGLSVFKMNCVIAVALSQKQSLKLRNAFILCLSKNSLKGLTLWYWTKSFEIATGSVKVFTTVCLDGLLDW